MEEQKARAEQAGTGELGDAEVQKKSRGGVFKDFLKCHKCGHHTSAGRRAFDLSNLGVKTWCKICKKAWEVKLWKCSCSIPWHQCVVHKEAPKKTREASKEEKNTTRGNVQQATERGKRSLEEAEDRSKSKRAKTKPENVNFSAKECAAVCTAVTSARVQRLLAGRLKHLVKNRM